MAMQVIATVAELRAALRGIGPIALVPTMGNLHDGHLALMRAAREYVGPSGCVVVSIFVNRLQFGPAEDFDKYPRSFSDDCSRCAAAGVDLIFAPGEAEMYPVAQRCVVQPSAIEQLLDGAVRPGHFVGVATVVLKLFNMVQPAVAVFGKKDYQQCRVLIEMTEQFDLPIKLLIADTVRAADGLALSSRNRYLSQAERIEAPRLYQTLQRIAALVSAGRRDFVALEAAEITQLTARGWRPDYLTIRRRSDLLVPIAGDNALVVLAAARLGAARLIDNLEVGLPG